MSAHFTQATRIAASARSIWVRPVTGSATPRRRCASRLRSFAAASRTNQPPASSPRPARRPAARSGPPGCRSSRASHPEPRTAWMRDKVKRSDWRLSRPSPRQGRRVRGPHAGREIEEQELEGRLGGGHRRGLAGAGDVPRRRAARVQVAEHRLAAVRGPGVGAAIWSRRAADGREKREVLGLAAAVRRRGVIQRRAGAFTSDTLVATSVSEMVSPVATPAATSHASKVAPASDDVSIR